MTREPFSLGLIGYPLAHSLSPALHNGALRALGLRGKYRLYPIAPPGEAEIRALLDRMRRGEINGLNVTIPHKQTVIPFLDALTPAAQAIGAVNTLFMEDDLLTGDNTDAPGFLADVKRLPVPSPPSALILGAGGAARAVAYALVSDGWAVTLAARRLEQAEAVRDQLSAGGSQRPTISILQFPIIQPPMPFSLLVNATPLGMAPQVETSPWPDELPMPEGAAVYDLVYNPPETYFLRQARAQGLRAANGLGMLTEQAALALERWVGR